MSDKKLTEEKWSNMSIGECIDWMLKVFPSYTAKRAFREYRGNFKKLPSQFQNLIVEGEEVLTLKEITTIPLTHIAFDFSLENENDKNEILVEVAYRDFGPKPCIQYFALNGNETYIGDNLRKRIKPITLKKKLFNELDSFWFVGFDDFGYMSNRAKYKKLEEMTNIIMKEINKKIYRKIIK